MLTEPERFSQVRWLHVLVCALAILGGGALIGFGVMGGESPDREGEKRGLSFENSRFPPGPAATLSAGVYLFLVERKVGGPPPYRGPRGGGTKGVPFTLETVAGVG